MKLSALPLERNPARLDRAARSTSRQRRRGGDLPVMPAPATGAKAGPGRFRRREPSVPGWKTGLDMICVIAGAIVLAPLAAAIAIWVKLVSPGPVLFRQERVGLGGRRFRLYKFRSMHPTASTDLHEHHATQFIRNNRPMTKLDELGDRRVIPGGRLLRALGLDELPQLINVWRREMSLVGPRPCLPSEAGRYRPRDWERFDTLPGLTGFWQVNGKNRTTFREMIAMDVHYARRKSLRMDLLIILKTPFAILEQATTNFANAKERSGSDESADGARPA